MRSVVVIAALLVFGFMGCARRVGDAPAPDGKDRSKGGAIWGANYFPNIPLVSHRGERARFFDLIRDKVVAVNFIYTSCSDSCPMETARMVEVQKLLGERMGKDVFFYSISIDPEHDTPARLAKYAQTWHTGPGWTFLTGAADDVSYLRKKLGVYEADLTQKNHNLGLLIGNQKTGRWMKRSPFENPYLLATQLGSWLHNWKLVSTAERDYARAPEVRNISSGEELFRARCASCHTVGDADRSNAAARRTGPDLFAVTQRRERAWLERWIMQPDRMLADKDPVALQLLAQNKNVVMPNLRVSRDDTAAILGYLAETSRAEPAAPSGIEPALASYEQLRERLATDDLPGARAQAAPLSAAGSSPDLAAVARSVGQAADLDSARRAFGELSKRVITLLIQHPELRRDRTLFLCPMAKGYKNWVQTSGPIDNPYMGKRMPHCGIQLTDWSAATSS